MTPHGDTVTRSRPWTPGRPQVDTLSVIPILVTPVPGPVSIQQIENDPSLAPWYSAHGRSAVEPDTPNESETATRPDQGSPLTQIGRLLESGDDVTARRLFGDHIGREVRNIHATAIRLRGGVVFYIGTKLLSTTHPTPSSTPDRVWNRGDIREVLRREVVDFEVLVRNSLLDDVGLLHTFKSAVFDEGRTGRRACVTEKSITDLLMGASRVDVFVSMVQSRDPFRDLTHLLQCDDCCTSFKAMNRLFNGQAHDTVPSTVPAGTGGEGSMGPRTGCDTAPSSHCDAAGTEGGGEQSDTAPTDMECDSLAQIVEELRQSWGSDSQYAPANALESAIQSILGLSWEGPPHHPKTLRECSILHEVATRGFESDGDRVFSEITSFCTRWSRAAVFPFDQMIEDTKNGEPFVVVIHRPVWDEMMTRPMYVQDGREISQAEFVTRCTLEYYSSLLVTPSASRVTFTRDLVADLIKKHGELPVKLTGHEQAVRSCTLAEFARGTTAAGQAITEGSVMPHDAFSTRQREQLAGCALLRAFEGQTQSTGIRPLSSRKAALCKLSREEADYQYAVFTSWSNSNKMLERIGRPTVALVATPAAAMHAPKGIHKRKYTRLHAQRRSERALNRPTRTWSMSIACDFQFQRRPTPVRICHGISSRRLSRV